MKSQKFWQRVFSIFLIAGLILGMAAPTSSIAASPPPPKLEQNVPDVEPALLEELQARGSAGYLIYFSEKADLSPALELDWEARGWFVMETLQSAAEQAQRQVRAYLDREQVSYKAFWIDNVIVVNETDLMTFNGLFTFPEIEVIRAQREPMLYEPVEANDVLDAAILAAESNLVHIQVPEVWDMGVTGQGIVVANIDTGVRYTHQALVNQYRGNLGGGSFDHNYSWWDPYQGTSIPSDFNDHGSHTIGTMIGDDGSANQIGLAPGAKWIACKSFEGGSVTAQLLECGQFMAAPWNLNGQNPNPSLRPHVSTTPGGIAGRHLIPGTTVY
jgi:subtilisin family serine protease